MDGVSPNAGPGIVIAGCLALLGVSGYRALTFDPVTWATLLGALQGDGNASAASARSDLTKHPRAQPGRGEPEPARAEDATPAENELLDPPATAVLPATGVPRPGRLAEAMGWHQLGSLAATDGGSLRFFDPLRWPPRSSAPTHAMLPAAASPAVLAHAADPSAAGEPWPVLELHYVARPARRTELEATIQCASGWIACADPRALREVDGALGPDAVIEFDSEVARFLPRAEVAAIARSLSAAGVELVQDAAGRWRCTGALAANVEAAQALLVSHARAPRIVCVRSQALHDLSVTTLRTLPLCDRQPPWGIACRVGLTGAWQIESLWDGEVRVGYRLRYVGP